MYIYCHFPFLINFFKYWRPLALSVLAGTPLVVKLATNAIVQEHLNKRRSDRQGQKMKKKMRETPFIILQ